MIAGRPLIEAARYRACASRGEAHGGGAHDVNVAGGGAEGAEPDRQVRLELKPALTQNSGRPHTPKGEDGRKS
jgi:hypothetical protein